MKKQESDDADADRKNSPGQVADGSIDPVEKKEHTHVPEVGDHSRKEQDPPERCLHIQKYGHPDKDGDGEQRLAPEKNGRMLLILPHQSGIQHIHQGP